MSGKKDPCVKFSCMLEKCTRIHNYNADKCQKELENMLKCCRQFGPRMAFSCEGFHELDEHYERMDEQQKNDQQN